MKLDYLLMSYTTMKFQTRNRKNNYFCNCNQKNTDIFFGGGAGREWEDPRWQRSKWKLHKPPLRTNLELQLNCREIILNNQLNTSWR